jgi:hypothetical protein
MACHVGRQSALVAVLATLVILAAPPASRADLILTYQGLNQGLTLGIDLPDSSSSIIAAQVGQYKWKDAAGNFLTTYCVDLLQTFSTAPVTYTPGELSAAPRPQGGGISADGMGASRASDIEELWHQYFDSLSTNTDHAAFQIAIWRIIYGDSFTIANANGTTASGSVAQAVSQANAWYADVTSHDYAGTPLQALLSMTKQDQVTPAAVPCPPALQLATAGIVVLLGSLWRQRQGRVSGTMAG